MTHKDSWTSTESDRRSRLSIVVWSLMWATSFVIGKQLLSSQSIEGAVGTWAVAVAVSVIGVGWLVAYVRFLREADELVRQIQLNAMAAALGVGLLVGFGSILLDSGGIAEATPTALLMPMILTYMLTVVLGQFRYTRQVK